MVDVNMLSIDDYMITRVGDTRLDIVKQYNKPFEITGFSSLLTSYDEKSENIIASKTKNNFYGQSNSYFGANIYFGTKDNKVTEFDAKNRNVHIVPVINTASNLFPLPSREIKTAEGKIITLYRFGEYPQTVVNDDSHETTELSTKLNEALLAKSLTPAADYTFYTPNYLGEMEEITHKAYEFNNEKYVYLKKSTREYAPYWIKVEPVEWLYDEKTDRLISAKALFSGIPMNVKLNSRNFSDTTIKEYLQNHFAKELGLMTDEKQKSNSNFHYFNNSVMTSVTPAKKIGDAQPSNSAPSHFHDLQHFQEYQPATTNTQQPQNTKTMPTVQPAIPAAPVVEPQKETQQPAKIEEPHKKDDLKKENKTKLPKRPHRKKYGITIDESPMSVKEQIDFYVQNGMSFMLHGQSGVGKTARVEEIDPDLTAVPLWNGVLPEDIVGKVRYPDGSIAEATAENMSSNNGVWVEPDWYTELCRKCAQEPNKMHVLFIDEVTNARPTTQSLIFHITLKKSISPSKGRLPENSVVVLAGNSKEESGAAYNMPEPLFRRMCGHIYLKPNIVDWLEWGSEKSRKRQDEYDDRQNIHPLVSSFVAAYGDKVFYSEYDEEDPKSYAIDPRGWEQVSDIIYDNQGVIRRELLESKLGKNIATSFMAFAKNPPLSVEDIIHNNYFNDDIPHDRVGQIALTYNLRNVDDRNVDKIRNFIQQNLGSENCKLFDSIWAKDNDERMLRISRMSTPQAKYMKDNCYGF